LDEALGLLAGARERHEEMIFTASDGKTFEDRSAWRLYEFELSYTFRNKKDETLVKLPGQIEGCVCSGILWCLERIWLMSYGCVAVVNLSTSRIWRDAQSCCWTTSTRCRSTT